MFALTKFAQNNYFCLGLLIAALTATYFRFSLLTVCLFLFAFVRVILCYSRKIIFASVFLVILFLLRFYCFQTSLQQQTLPNQQDAQIKVRLYADEIIVNGDQLKAKAFDLTHKHKIVLYAKIKSAVEKLFWENNRENLICLVNGDVGRPQRATNFFQFDVRDYFSTQSITNQLSQSSFERVSKWRPKNIFNIINERIHFFRKALIDYLNVMPSPLSEYARSLFIGDLDNDFYQQYPGVTDLGLIHLFSISGFQVSYFFIFLRKLFKQIHLRKEHALILIAATMPLFFVFSGAVQSLLRPVIAAELMAVGGLFHLRVSKEIIWSGSLLIGIGLSPMILFSIGGQLSYLLSFSLLFIGHLKKFQQGLLMSLVSMPIVLGAKFTWHLLSTPANFFAIPIFGIVIMPLIAIAACLQPFLPIVTNTINYLIQLFAELIEWISQLPGKIVFGKLDDWLIVPLVILILLAFDERKKLRKISTTLAAIILISSFLWIHLPKNGEFSAFDIGQGDALLLRTPGNQQTVLIDTGGKVVLPKQGWQQSVAVSNQAKSIIVNYLQAKGIGHVDFLVLSHGDMDHIGNAKYLFAQMRVDRLLIPAGMLQTHAFKKEILPYLNKTQVIEVTADTKINRFPFQIVHPFTSGQAENEDSIALFTKIGGLTVFTAGDLPKEGESAIQKRYPQLKVDLIKFGHHGSNTSSDKRVLQDWQVRFGIISAGRHNRYGHPKSDMLKTISDLHIQSFNTQTNGMTRFVYTDKKSYFQTFTKDFDDTE